MPWAGSEVGMFNSRIGGLRWCVFMTVLSPSVSLAGWLSCFLASLHFSLAFRSWWGLISLLFFFSWRSSSKVTSSYVPIILSSSLRQPVSDRRLWDDLSFKSGKTSVSTLSCGSLHLRMFSDSEWLIVQKPCVSAFFILARWIEITQF